MFNHQSSKPQTPPKDNKTDTHRKRARNSPSVLDRAMPSASSATASSDTVCEASSVHKNSPTAGTYTHRDKRACHRSSSVPPNISATALACAASEMVFRALSSSTTAAPAIVNNGNVTPKCPGGASVTIIDPVDESNSDATEPIDHGDDNLGLAALVADPQDLTDDRQDLTASIVADSAQKLSNFREQKEIADRMESEGRKKVEEARKHLVKVQQQVLVPHRGDDDEFYIISAEVRLAEAEKKLRKLHDAISHWEKSIIASQDAGLDDVLINTLQEKVIVRLKDIAKGRQETITFRLAPAAAKAQQLAAAKQAIIEAEGGLRNAEAFSDFLRRQVHWWQRHHTMICLGLGNITRLVDGGIVPDFSEEELDQGRSC